LCRMFWSFLLDNARGGECNPNAKGGTSYPQ
jgi:hypothetical protein